MLQENVKHANIHFFVLSSCMQSLDHDKIKKIHFHHIWQQKSQCYTYVSIYWNCDWLWNKSSLGKLKKQKYKIPESTYEMLSWWLKKNFSAMQKDLKEVPPQFQNSPKSNNANWPILQLSEPTWGKWLHRIQQQNHTNTGLIIMCRIFSNITTISFNLHFKWTFTCTEKLVKTMKQLATMIVLMLSN